MIIGFMGDLGSGKTLGMTILGYSIYFLSDKKLKIFSNYKVKGAYKIYKISQLFKIKNGIILLDELHILIDSRLWRYNKYLVDYFLQIRKYNNFLLFTTQHFKQIDVRIRNVCQYLFYCQRFKNYFKYTLIDTLYKDIKKTIILPKNEAEKFYKYYNTFEAIKKLPKK